VVHPTVPRLQRVIDVEGVEGRALELALIQARVELELAQGLLEAILVDHGRCMSLAVVRVGNACTE
jgi:hypothetical protein